MGTVIAQSIIDKAQQTLQDETGVQWTEAELFGYLNDGQRAIVVLKPQAYIKHTTPQLAAGARQTVPADGHAFAQAQCNMGTDGVTPGAVINNVSKADLDLSYPGWRAATASATVRDAMADPNDPTIFWVSPPQPTVSRGYIELSYGAVPADVAAIGSAITLNDIYAIALQTYVVARALAKETEAADPAKAERYHNLFSQQLGIRAAAESGQ